MLQNAVSTALVTEYQTGPIKQFLGNSAPLFIDQIQICTTTFN